MEMCRQAQKQQFCTLYWGCETAVLRLKLELLTKCPFLQKNCRTGIKKRCSGGYPRHRIIRYRLSAVADKRQWSSAASNPRRNTRVKLWPHFCAAKVPSLQICRLRSASRYAGVSSREKSRAAASAK